MGTSVREAMTPVVRTASPEQSLVDAAQMMKSDDAGAIPVVDGGRLVGIVTDRDIAVRAVAEGVDPRTTTIDKIATGDLVTVHSDHDLDEALALMARHQVRRLPVVEASDGQVVGILAQADVALWAKEKKAGEMLEQISQPTSTARE
jgi:CBS domain-containing protein